ncbi:S8 family peptidase [Chitinimonas sp. BJB300]|uniref:S8 family peptidase n=1 Tax=Chitinimonas sp. BJB300 TaxID=1559339 RepID=UPI000C0C5AA9|nr:S8 family peptidase [Chitinimonas sp. BJB300]PHV11015.1 peptidase S8 and S53 subtilisin kexin sedolisin [Chitinimonas sp. BJB300]TSJ87018.1 S8 family peptidase [Chitinimonas sp. BJB300]
MTNSPAQWALLAIASGLAASAAADDIRRPYIVQLADKPVAIYAGGISGLKATQPAPGARLDVQAADVQAYINYLDTKQSNVLASIGSVQKVYDYKLVFNGFSALLTDKEVRALKKDAGVLAITQDAPRELLTNYTPSFLGLDKPGVGLWSQLGGPALSGENVIIGVIDSGIWPENPAFADRVDAQGVPTFDNAATLAYEAPPETWKGTCLTSSSFPACNNKLIGAQIFRDQFDALVAQGMYTPHWSDYVSPRDNGGHGTHTSSTAAGNNKVAVSMGGVALGSASGIAPRARVAMYKVCWSYNDPQIPGAAKNSCFTADSVKAIETAVADGVNVLNYSISGSQTSMLDPVEQAFFGASNAGVFVAASAGNSGPANQVAHISPWLTTVAASTHDRFYEGSANLGNGTTVTGASLNQTPVEASSMILASAAGMAGADAVALRECWNTGVLDPAKVAGKVVVCDRGTVARTDKSAAVKVAGGAGMILVNVIANQSVNADLHTIPSLHVDNVKGATIKAYAAQAGASTAISKGELKAGTIPAPLMADFSSRGPNKGEMNSLKPDLTAPGVDILAGYIPDQTQAEHDAINNGSVVPPAAWNFLQGTSMSSPHVAGLAALLRNKFPTWTPAAIKSALMTTGYSTLDDGQPGQANGRLPWAQGAGHVSPNAAGNPGLVYDAASSDYIRYMCGANVGLSPAVCSAFGSTQPYNLNLPSLTAANVLGSLTFQRTVTNVADTPSTYTATATLSGFKVTVSPESMMLNPGEKKSFTVKLERTSAPQDVWQFGSLVWSDGTHNVRSPLTARSGAMLAAPAQLASEAASGSKVFSVGTGFSGKLTAAQGGLKEATRISGNVLKATTDGNAACKAGNDPTGGLKVHEFVVPANNLVTRFDLYDADTEHGSSDDLDLIVMNSAGVVLGTSLNGGSDETVQAVNLPAGTYKACVLGYAPRGGSANYTMSAWAVNAGDTGGDFKVLMPSKAYAGGTASVGMSWKNLPTGKRFLGAVRYSADGFEQGNTVLLVQTNDPLPATGAGERTRPVDAGV